MKQDNELSPYGKFFMELRGYRIYNIWGQKIDRAEAYKTGHTAQEFLKGKTAFRVVSEGLK